MGQRGHLAPKASVDDPVIERCFRCGHGIIGSPVDEVSYRLDDDLIIAVDQRIEIDTHISCDGTNDLLVSKIASNGIDAGRVATGGDNTGQAL